MDMTRRNVLKGLGLLGITLGCSSEPEKLPYIPYNGVSDASEAPRRPAHDASAGETGEAPQRPVSDESAGETSSEGPFAPTKTRYGSLDEVRKAWNGETTQPKPISVYGKISRAKKYGETRVVFEVEDIVKGKKVIVDTTNTKGKIIGLDQMLTSTKSTCTTDTTDKIGKDKLCISEYTLDAQVDTEGNAIYVSVAPTFKLNDQVYTSRDALVRDRDAAKDRKERNIYNDAIKEYDRITGTVELPSTDLTPKYASSEGTYGSRKGSPLARKSAARAIVDGAKSVTGDATHYLGRGLRSVTRDLFGN
ncbi:hypothetical protein HYY69_03900 [Candidatus Woesearchaeota archaeon]|nr:hypothetical protein [Candidatus Woesearchaeota archaeon]